MDEIALLKLTGTLLDGLRHPLAVTLSDEQVCTAVETTFRLCFQTRFSEMMRQSSCFVAIGMIHLLFSHLPRLLQNEPVELKKIKPISLPFAKVSDGPETPAMESKSNLDETVVVGSPTHLSATPFSILALVEILVFLAKLLDGSRLDDKGRCLAADAVGVFLETTRNDLSSSPHLMKILSNEACRNLIALVNINTAPQVLRQLMHPVGALFRLYRRTFVSQFGFLLEKLIDALRTKPAANPRTMPRYVEVKTVLLEITQEFLEDQSIMVDMYVHYECDMRYSMLLTELVACLKELSGSFDQKNGGSESMALLAVQTLNRMMYEMGLHGKDFKMSGGVSNMPSPTESASNDFSESRRMKQIMQEAVALYNRKPREAFSFLYRQGLISDPPTSEEIARFLRRTPGLNKRTLGEYLAKEGNEDILRGYLADFDFKAGETIENALRKVLESFRLPGEAQQIDRVVEAFAAVYYVMVGKEAAFASQDATHVLSFSIIMLNTDLYNPQNQRRMTLDEFIRNNRGINDGIDFDKALLIHIYKEISEREIVLPEEVQTSDFVWMEVVRRADSYAQGLDIMPTLPHASSAAQLSGIVGLLFPPLLSCYLSSSPRPEEISQLCFSGIDLMSRVLADLELHPLMAELIEALWQATGIPAQLTNTPASTSPRPVGSSQLASPAPVTLASSAIRARTIRHVAKSEACQRTLQTLFAIVQVSGPNLRAGWRTVCAALFAFADAGLLHLEMVDPGLRDEIRKATNLEVKPGTPFDSKTLVGQPAPSSNGILSAFSSYIVSSSPETAGTGSDEEYIDPELKRRALHAVRESCQLDRILQETRYFQADSLHALLQALSQGLLFSAASSKDHGVSEQSMVIVLELLVYVAWQNRDRLVDFWPLLSNCLADLSKLQMKRVCEHAVMGLGRICLWLADRTASSQSDSGDNLEALEGPPPLFFQVLCHVAPDIFEYISDAGTSLALRIVQAGKSGVGLSSALWPHYFTLLSKASRIRACDASTYGLLALLVPRTKADSMLLPLDFFTEYCDLLVSFISNSIDVPPGKEVTPLSLASKDSVRGTQDAQPSSEKPLAAAISCLESLCELQTRLLHYDWASYILPLHMEVAKLCTHKLRILRQHCLSLLQRLILNLNFSQSESSRDALPCVFNDVLLPLLADLHSLAEADRRAMDAVEETEMRASSILCKIFLHNLPLLLDSQKDGEFLRLWMAVLKTLLGLMEGRSEILRESIPESIKNMLLVMATTGPLAIEHGVTEEVGAFWNATWELLDPVIPRLHQDLAALTAPPPSQKVVEESRQQSAELVEPHSKTEEIPQDREEHDEIVKTSSLPEAELPNMLDHGVTNEEVESENIFQEKETMPSPSAHDGLGAEEPAQDSPEVHDQLSSVYKYLDAGVTSEATVHVEPSPPHIELDRPTTLFEV